MFNDNTLTPREAARLCALGILAQEPMSYAALATAIRHFTGRILGPSLDLMGTSIELLKYEGFVESSGGGGMEDDADLVITDEGRRELTILLTANLRAAATEMNKLIIALKFRFLHLLDQDDRLTQADLLLNVTENELARLIDLRQYHAQDRGYLVEWLDHDIETLESRLEWLKSFRRRIAE
jgi:DNA-binding PadR family transcriptional regulator